MNRDILIEDELFAALVKFRLRSSRSVDQLDKTETCVFCKKTLYRGRKAIQYIYDITVPGYSGGGCKAYSHPDNHACAFKRAVR